MIVPVTIFLGFNFSVFNPAKVSALLMFSCCVIGLSILNKFKDIGGTVCITICVIMLIMRSEAWYVTAMSIGIFGASNLTSSLVLFKLGKLYKERAKNGK